jgi:hypothetical protein
MMRIVKCLVLFLAVCGSISFAVRDGGACSVPVFRYALERWKPDPYKGIFIYRGKLSAQDQALIRKFEAITLNTENPFNLRIRPVEVGAFSEEKLNALLKGPIPRKLPVLAIWYPEQMGRAAPFWMQEVTPAGLKALVNSPKRRQLTEGLINGESIFWVFIPSGNSQKDESAQIILRRELDRALVALAKNPLFVSTGSKGKKLGYSCPILTLSRSDPQERFFLDMLLHSETDLYERKDDPIVFAIFGRGRILGGILGERINEKNIQGMVTYLAGSCSCEIKAQHPGMDLLLSADWDKVVMGELFATDDTPAPALTGVMPEASKPVSAAVDKTEKPRQHSSLWKIYGLTLGSAIVVVVFAGLILKRRRKENP